MIIVKQINNVITDKDGSLYCNFYKKRKSDKIWWTSKIDVIGEYLFSFNKKKLYNLFKDYPQNLTKKEKQIFDKENPYWKKFFKC